MAYKSFDILQTQNDKREIKGFKLEKPAQKILVSRSGVEGSRERPLDLSQFVKSDFFL